MTSDQIIANLKQLANAQAVEGMARFGIRPAQALGISIPTLRKMAKDIGKNHVLALALWDSGIHEARILASMIAEPQFVSVELMEEWVNDFDSWDVCDQVCGTSLALKKLPRKEAHRFNLSAVNKAHNQFLYPRLFILRQPLANLFRCANQPLLAQFFQVVALLWR